MTARALLVLFFFLTIYSPNGLAANSHTNEKKPKAEIKSLLSRNDSVAKKRLNEIRRMNGYTNKNPSKPNNDDIAYLLLIQEAKAEVLYNLAIKFKDAYPVEAAEYLVKASDKGHIKAKEATSQYQNLTTFKSRKERSLCAHLTSLDKAKKTEKNPSFSPLQAINNNTQEKPIDLNTKNANEQYIIATRYYRRFQETKWPNNKKFKQRAITYLELAANQNHTQAILELIYAYKSEPRYYKDAIRLASKLSDEGLAAGQYELGKIHLSDIHGVKNEEEGRRLLQKAADQGHMLAKQRLKSLDTNSAENTEEINLIKLIKTLELEDDNEKMVDKDCTVNLSQNEATALIENNTKFNAETITKQMAEMGDTESQYLLGMSFAKGLQESKKYNKKAKYWLKLAAEKDYPPAMLALARFLLLDNQSTASDSSAREAYVLLNKVLFYTKDENILTEARHLLYYCLTLGIGVLRNLGAAQNLLNIALLQKDKWATQALPYNQSSEATNKAKVAAENGDIEAMFEMGHRYFTGNGVEADIIDALKNFELAAQKGLKKAQSMLNVISMLDKGVLTEPDGIPIPDKNYEGSPWDTFIKALCYVRGIGTEKNIKMGMDLLHEILRDEGSQTARLFAKIIIKKFPPHDYQLPTDMLYNLGKELEVSKPKNSAAVFLFAAYLGHRDSQYELGKYFQRNSIKYELGELDIHWFRIAAMLGHEGARQELNRIKELKEALPDVKPPTVERKKRQKEINDTPKLWLPPREQAPIDILAYNPNIPLERKGEEEEFAGLLQAANNNDSAAGVRVGHIYYKRQDLSLAKAYFLRSLTDTNLDLHSKTVAIKKLHKIDPDFVFNPDTIQGICERNSFSLRNFCHEGKKLCNLYEINTPVVREHTLLPLPKPTPILDNSIKFERAPLYEKNIKALNISEADEERLFKKLQEKPKTIKIMQRMNGHQVMKRNFHIENYYIGRVAYLYEERINKITLLAAIQKGSDENFPPEFQEAIKEFLDDRAK